MNKGQVFEYILRLEDGLNSLLDGNPIKDMLVFEIINGALIYAHELDSSNLSDEQTARGVVELVIKSLLTKDMLMKAYCKHVNCYNTFGIGNKNKLVHNINRETNYVNTLVDKDIELKAITKTLCDYVNNFHIKKFSIKQNIMKVLKVIGQILASLVYTPLYTGIMYLVIVLPTMWIITLSFWKMLLAIVVLGGITEALIMLLQTLGLLPYSWITKNNKVAYVTSMILCVVLPLYNIFTLWRIGLGHGTFGIVAALILSGLLLKFVFVSLYGIYGMKNEKEKF